LLQVAKYEKNPRLAALAVAGGAFAQSSVFVFGKLGVAYIPK
jgi:hypothetical protein